MGQPLAVIRPICNRSGRLFVAGKHILAVALHECGGLRRLLVIPLPAESIAPPPPVGSVSVSVPDKIPLARRDMSSQDEVSESVGRPGSDGYHLESSLGVEGVKQKLHIAGIHLEDPEDAVPRPPAWPESVRLGNHLGR